MQTTPTASCGSNAAIFSSFRQIRCCCCCCCSISMVAHNLEHLMTRIKKNALKSAKSAYCLPFHCAQVAETNKKNNNSSNRKLMTTLLFILCHLDLLHTLLSFYSFCKRFRLSGEYGECSNTMRKHFVI